MLKNNHHDIFRLSYEIFRFKAIQLISRHSYLLISKFSKLYVTVSCKKANIDTDCEATNATDNKANVETFHGENAIHKDSIQSISGTVPLI